VPLQGGSTLPPSGKPANIYEWLLSNALGTSGRTLLTQPSFASIDAGSDQILNLSSGSLILNSHDISSSGSINLTGAVISAPHTIASVQWVRVDGNGGTITNPNSLSTTVTNLKPGLYTYQLRVTDDQGLTTVDNVHITVNAPSDITYRKIEAENYSALNPGNWYEEPILNKTYIDEGPTYGLGEWNSGKWAEYSLNLPASGIYAVYYRYKSDYNNPSVSIIVDGNITYNRTLSSTAAWRSDSVKLHLSSNSTIRFVSNSNNAELDLNYFELVLLSADAPLPVKFVYFNAACQGGEVNLRWKTSQEQGSQDYTVQRSVDGISWVNIGSVAAAGQSTQERSYVFADRNASSGSNFYRIVEHDYSGQQSVSSIVKSSCSLKQGISLYPNPSSGSSALRISLDRSANVTVEILDSRGALLQQKQLQLPQGTNTIPLDVSSYAKGVYTVKVNYDSDVQTIKMIKK